VRIGRSDADRQRDGSTKARLDATVLAENRTRFVPLGESRSLAIGTWGPAIFSDDTACDVRDDWREFVGDGLSAPQATDKLLAQLGDAIDDPDDRPVIWLALAATQWKAGRLEDRVKEQALAIIDGGADLQRWTENPALLKKRKAVLTKLREQLASPPARPVRIRKVTKSTCEWAPGEVVAYTLRSGRFVLFRVLGLNTDKGGVHPDCQFYDWIGKEIPGARVIKGLRFKVGAAMICGGGKKGYPADRLTRTGIKLPVQGSEAQFAVGVWLWNMVDDRLLENWGYR